MPETHNCIGVEIARNPLLGLLLDEAWHCRQCKSAPEHASPLYEYCRAEICWAAGAVAQAAPWFTATR